MIAGERTTHIGPRRLARRLRRGAQVQSPQAHGDPVNSGRRDQVGYRKFSRRVRTSLLETETHPGIVTLPSRAHEMAGHRQSQAAAVASRHVLIAAARSVWCVWADVRCRWTLKVLKTAAWVERNL